MFAPRKPGESGAFFKSNSLSGGERHRVFFQRDGNFKEFTLTSGADFREDGRGFVLFDFNQDGYLDLGITSPNSPRFRILKNQIPQLVKDGGFVSLELVGGQASNEPSDQWSSRDAYGATATAKIGEVERKFQLSLGEGLSGQNAKRIHIGLGAAKKIDQLTVSWPSGKQTVLKDVMPNQRLTVLENSSAE